MLATNWDAGTTCRSCGGEILVGADMIYRQHPGCAGKEASARRQQAGEAEDVVEIAHLRLAAKGRIVLTSRQLRQLIIRSGVAPVRKPDMGAGRVEWYGRLKGWTSERVAGGLSAEEVAGLWLDFLDIGRQPPIRHDDLDKILAAIGASAAA